MKKIIFVVSFVLVCSLSSAQEGSQLDKMINESLFSYLNNWADSYSRVCRDCKEYDIYICLDGYPRNFVFSEEIRNMKNLKGMRSVKFVSFMNLSGQKELKRGKWYGVVFPGISLEKNRLIISVTKGSISVTGNNQLKKSFYDWGNYTYEYFPDKQEWILVKTEYDGL